MPLTIAAHFTRLFERTPIGEESNRLRAGEAIQKMWARQPGLWKDDAEHARIIANRLGWIGVLDSMRAEAPALEDLARDITQSGVRDIVLLGMGGSSLAPEVFSLIFPAPAGQALFRAGLDRSRSDPGSGTLD